MWWTAYFWILWSIRWEVWGLYSRTQSNVPKSAKPIWDWAQKLVGGVTHRQAAIQKLMVMAMDSRFRQTDSLPNIANVFYNSVGISYLCCSGNRGIHIFVKPPYCLSHDCFILNVVCSGKMNKTCQDDHMYKNQWHWWCKYIYSIYCGWLNWIFSSFFFLNNDRKNLKAVIILTE